MLMCFATKALEYDLKGNDFGHGVHSMKILAQQNCRYILLFWEALEKRVSFIITLHWQYVFQ